MKTKLQLLTIFTISAFILPIITLGQISSFPAIPLLVYGTVIVDGNLAPVGTIITAEIDDVEVSSIQTVDVGVYFIDVPDGQANEGKMIKFKVIGIANDANQCEDVNIATNPVINLDLAVTSPSSPPSTPPVVPGGGGGITTIPTTTPTPLSEAAQAVDTNGDGKIDIFDFNSLVVNWGSTVAGNIADFDSNGTVDIFDFNLLMTYWTG